MLEQIIKQSMCSQPEGGKACGAYGHSRVKSKSSRTNLISFYDRVTGHVDKVEAIDVIDLRPQPGICFCPTWQAPWQAGSLWFRPGVNNPGALTQDGRGFGSCHALLLAPSPQWVDVHCHTILFDKHLSCASWICAPWHLITVCWMNDWMLRHRSCKLRRVAQGT